MYWQPLVRTARVHVQLMGVHITLRKRLECTIKRRGERQPPRMEQEQPSWRCTC